MMGELVRVHTVSSRREFGAEYRAKPGSWGRIYLTDRCHSWNGIVAGFVESGM